MQVKNQLPDFLFRISAGVKNSDNGYVLVFFVDGINYQKR